jgi:outer membrane receptor protein involved in Fe transport
MRRSLGVGIALLCAAAPAVRAAPGPGATSQGAAEPSGSNSTAPTDDAAAAATSADADAGEVISVEAEAPPAVPGAVRASRDELAAIPGTSGDLMQALAAMPGVASTALPLGASGVVIRGSSPQDSKILIDGFEVPVLYHDLGFRSVVREQAIETLDYLPGGFDASMGRATSGIVRLTTRAGGDGPRVEVDNSTGDLGALVQGKAGDLRYMVAVRRSMIDLLLPLVLPDDLDLSLVTVPRYYDEQLRLDYRLSSHWDVRLSSLGSDDALDLYTDRVGDPAHHFADRTRFIRGTGAAAYRDGAWSARLELSGIAEQHTTELGAAQHVRATAPAVTARAEVERTWGDVLGLTGVSVRAGGEIVDTRYDLDIALPAETREGETMAAYDPADTSLRTRGRIATDDMAAWTVASASAGPRVRATAGVRIDAYRRTGEVAVQPRGDVSVRLRPTLVARASAGGYSRPPEYQSELLSPMLRAERATQLIGGLDWTPVTGLQVQASIYDTERSDLVTRVPSGRVTDDSAGALTNAGRGTTYGAELAATLRRGAWLGWLSYSYAHSTRVDAPGAPARWFDYDQPHHLEALASYTAGDWTFGARFRLLSGLPYTPVAATVFDSDRNLYVPIYGAVNSARNEFHHEIDVRIERRSRWGPLHLTRYLDVQNVYMNQTTVMYLYSYDYSQRMALRWLPILPTVGIRASW